MRDVTIIFPYYENATMFERQQRHIMSLPAAIREHLHVSVCDDCSIDHASEHVLADFAASVSSFQLFRVLEKRRWNWLTCRNICWHHCKTEWAIHTDIDHTIPADTLRWMMGDDLDADKVYFPFLRQDMPDLTHNPKHHPNTWFHTKAMYDKIGGYDERFSGNYGTDSDFRFRAEQASGGFVAVDKYITRWPREIVLDASCPDSFGRKNQDDKERVKSIKAERELIPGWRPLRLTFPYERVI